MLTDTGYEYDLQYMFSGINLQMKRHLHEGM